MADPDDLRCVGEYLARNGTRFVSGYGRELVVFGANLRPDVADRKHREFIHYMTGARPVGSLGLLAGGPHG